VTGNENAPVCKFKQRRQGHAAQLGLTNRISIARQALRTRALLGARHDRPFPSMLDFNPGPVDASERWLSHRPLDQSHESSKGSLRDISIM
jgi:hypothetical protein